MLLKAFPDIHWIRNKAKTNFEEHGVESRFIG